MLKAQSLSISIDPDFVAFLKFSFKNFNRQGILNQTLDSPLKRPGAINRVVTLVGQANPWRHR